eukprot:TRINITY_DN1019_c1_g1_i1.p1 TRINITY_DN1019_c1_g1~~TRINITY_DN1019_c1_g1_i1.p1  ORF type:complete len:523 (+),score=118.24 TRINITY_DN1019_c1_g1_i1:69-1571(+)
MRSIAVLAAVVGCVADPNIWPLPQNVTSGTSSVTVDSTFTFSGTQSSDLKMAYGRYQKQLFPHSGANSGTLKTCMVTVANGAADLQLGVDESYTLSVSASDCKITAKTQFGAYYGMETLSQLVVFDFDTETYVIKGAPWSIVDAPRFSHREVLIDTSRHFQPLASLKNIITSFTYSKINTMHWHIVDAQSFPYNSPTYPKLGKMGAWSNYERFTQDDVKAVVEYARQRGVRVVIEVDTPGHASSWCKGHPEICPSASCTTPLNPATNATFDLIKGLFKDLQDATIDTSFHIGGDEVNTGCWTSTPSVNTWLEQNHMTADQAYGYFVGRVTDIVFGLGQHATGWEEIWNHFGTKLDKRTIIQQWLPGSTIAKNATAHGYRVIWSTDGVWYLDGLGVTWQKMYQQEPCNGLTDDECKLVIGGGGEMWGETVDTSDIQNTIWPRMAAIAERLWSDRSVTDVTKAQTRIRYFRCLLNRRGIAAAPPSNPTAREAPKGPGSCFDQ